MLHIRSWSGGYFAAVDALYTFVIATVASFIGSLQAGLVNTAVLAHTIQRGRDAGRRMALGGALPELLYAALAFQFATWVVQWIGLDRSGVTILVGVLLGIIGLYFAFVFKPQFEVETIPTKASGVRRGLLLGLLNPQLILFWCGVRLTLTSFGIEGRGVPELIAFSLGAFVGALILLFQLVRLGRKAVETWKPSTLRLLFRLVGALLIISGVVSILRA